MKGRPADLPFTEHFRLMPCGTRAKYVGAGCRCMRCRAANSRYESERIRARRNGDWNGLVPAGLARRRLLRLSRAGVGRRAVSEAADVSQSVLAAIRSGDKIHIRARTEKRILAITPAARSGGALVEAGPTWRRISHLLDEGFTRGEIAIRLGYRRRALQIGKDVITARTATAVERLYRLVMQ